MRINFYKILDKISVSQIISCLSEINRINGKELLIFKIRNNTYPKVAPPGPDAFARPPPPLRTGLSSSFYSSFLCTGHSWNRCHIFRDRVRSNCNNTIATIYYRHSRDETIYVLRARFYYLNPTVFTELLFPLGAANFLPTRTPRGYKCEPSRRPN